MVAPRSACPKCDKPIAAYDNIPVLSWLLLGGRCRRCRTSISARYALVELLTGLLWLPGTAATLHCATSSPRSMRRKTANFGSSLVS